MPYAIKYWSRVAVQGGGHYDIHLEELDYTGDPIERFSSVPPFELNVAVANSDAVMPNVLATEMSWVTIADGPDELSEIFNADPEQYRLRLYRNGYLVFQGFVLTDLYEEPGDVYPMPLRITAIDGIGLLQDQPFEAASTERTSLIELLAAVLQETGQALPIVISDDLFDTEMDAEPGDNPWEQAALDPAIFAPEGKALSAVDVLVQLLQKGHRLHQAADRANPVEWLAAMVATDTGSQPDPALCHRLLETFSWGVPWYQWHSDAVAADTGTVPDPELAPAFTALLDVDVPASVDDSTLVWSMYRRAQLRAPARTAWRFDAAGVLEETFTASADLYIEGAEVAELTGTTRQLSRPVRRYLAEYAHGTELVPLLQNPGFEETDISDQALHWTGVGLSPSTQSPGLVGNRSLRMEGVALSALPGFEPGSLYVHQLGGEIRAIGSLSQVALSVSTFNYLQGLELPSGNFYSYVALRIGDHWLNGDGSFIEQSWPNWIEMFTPLGGAGGINLTSANLTSDVRGLCELFIHAPVDASVGEDKLDYMLVDNVSISILGAYTADDAVASQYYVGRAGRGLDVIDTLPIRYGDGPSVQHRGRVTLLPTGFSSTTWRRFGQTETIELQRLIAMEMIRQFGTANDRLNLQLMTELRPDLVIIRNGRRYVVNSVASVDPALRIWRAEIQEIRYDSPTFEYEDVVVFEE